MTPVITASGFTGTLKGLGAPKSSRVSWTVVQKTRRFDAVRHFRDVDGREVDFVIVEKRKPLTFVEVKWGDEDVAPGLRYLKQRFADVDTWQVSPTDTKDFVSRDGIHVAPATELLAMLV